MCTVAMTLDERLLGWVLRLRKRGLLCGIALGWLCAVSGSVSAQTSEIELGLGWLQSQVRPDGTVAGEATSVAYDYQVRAEVAQTLVSLATLPPALAQVVDAGDDGSTEASAREAIVAGARSVGATAQLADVLGAQNDDGGFGGSPGYSSNALDTALALAALKQQQAFESHPDEVARALSFLTSAMSSDAAWGVHEQSKIYVTSWVLQGAQVWNTEHAVASITVPARDWLLAARSGDSFGNPLDDAAALLALTTQTSDLAVLQPLATALVAAQGADGSWQSDPFITALALRALWNLSNPPPVSTTAGLAGVVLDGSSGAPVAGALVRLDELPGVSTNTQADGNFALSGIAAGSYTLRIDKLGFSGFAAVVNLAAGQLTNLGQINVVKAGLTATVKGVVHNSLGGPYSGATVAVGSLSTLTDTSGHYVLSGVEPTTATISVTASGYPQVVSVPIAFVAGQTYEFSPTFYAVAPPTTSLTGIVTDAHAGAVIAGATISLNGTDVQSGPDGHFAFANIGSGLSQLAASATGYRDMVEPIVLASGVNDVGRIALQVADVATELSGRVTDVHTGLPIAGASVSVMGRSVSTGADGSYAIAGIAASEFDVVASADGFFAMSQHVALGSPGAAVIDLALTPAQAIGIALDSVLSRQASYLPTDMLQIDVAVRNTTDQSADVVIDALVMDASNSVVMEMKANTHDLGQFPPNLPFSLAAGETITVPLEQLLLNQAAGEYTVLVRAHDVLGRALAEGQATFAIDSLAVLGGGLTADPPLTQAGTELPIAFRGQLANLGNVGIADGKMDLSVVVEHPDPRVSSKIRTEAIHLASSADLTQIRGMERDSGGNLYVVSNRSGDGRIFRIAPDGQISVVARIPSVLPDVPRLSDLVMDSAGAFWVSNANTGVVWRVPSQQTPELIRISSLDAVTGIALDGQGRLLLSGRFDSEDRLVRRDLAGSETVLWANGLSFPMGLVADASGNLYVANNADGTISRVTSDGGIEPFASGLARPMGVTLGGDGSLLVANNGDGTISRVDSGGNATVLAEGLPAPADLSVAPNGDLFVSCQGDNSIRRIDLGGQISVFARSIANRPRAMQYDSAGNLYIANDDGTLRRVDGSGEVSVLTTGLVNPRGLAIDPSDSSVLITNYGSSSVTRTNSSGTTLLSSGLSQPMGIAVGADGEFVVAEYGAHALSRFDADGTRLETVSTLFDSPTKIVTDPDGNVVVANTNGLTIIEAGGPRVFHGGLIGGANSIAPDPAGGAVYVVQGFSRELYRIAYDGSSTYLGRLPSFDYGISVDQEGNLYYADYFAQAILKRTPSGQIVEHASLPARPRMMVGTVDGTTFVLLTDGSIVRVSAVGQVETLSNPYQAPDWDYPNGLGVTSDGRPLVWTHTSKLMSIDPLNGALSVLLEGVKPSGATVDSQMNAHLTFSAAQDVVSFDAQGREIARWSGFGLPKEVVWDGTQYWFSDGSRLYSLAASQGTYPVKRDERTHISALSAGPGGSLYALYAKQLMRWNGNTLEDQASLEGVIAGNVGVPVASLAVRPLGGLAVADFARSQVTLLTSDYAVAERFAGIDGVTGLAFDALGHLYAAGTVSGNLVKFESIVESIANPAPFATISSPGWLDFDAAGQLWVSRPGSTSIVDPRGFVSSLPDALPVTGIRATPAGVFGSTGSSGQVVRWDGQKWQGFAAGLAAPEGLIERSGGSIDIVNRANGTLVEWQAGVVRYRAGGMSNPRGVTEWPGGGALTIVGDQGQVYRVADDGVVSSVGSSGLVGGANLFGVVATAVDRVAIAAATSSSGSLFELVIREPTVPPVPGTVVHQVSVDVPELSAGGDSQKLDLGEWIPTAPGDYSAHLSREGLAGEISTTFHVGSLAQGLLTGDKSVVKPGADQVGLHLSVSGSDFSSISRVETGLLRPTASSYRPQGFAADRSGNLILTTYFGTLMRVGPDGVATTLASGYRFGDGMAIDDLGNIYVPALDGHNVVRLERFAPDGHSEVLVPDLGGTVGGIAINSHGELLVGVPGRLLQISQEGQVSEFTRSGIPNPYGISVDGKDNVYVFNRNHLVTQIRPDRSVTTLFEGGDPAGNPHFEYEGVTVAGDCGEGVYLAPLAWESTTQAGEEHTLFHFNPRTGQVSSVLDGSKIHHDLGDMDYIVFDRFGSRILIWTDYSGGRIWQVPVTCGAISVEAHLITEPGQTLTGINRAPAAVVPLADGGSEYVWGLRDVTQAGITFGFDTLLEGLSLGESRPVVKSAHLLFENSFSPNKIKLPIAVPTVQVDNLVDLAVNSDKPAYRAGEAALLGSQLVNSRPAEVSGLLVVDVLDAAGVVLGQAAAEAVVVPAGGHIDLPGSYPIGSLYPATYTARATLFDGTEPVARARTDFQVLSDLGDGVASSTLALDQASYPASGLVGIDSSVLNSSANTLLGPLSVSLQIADPQGTVVFTKQISLAQLAAGSTQTYLNQYGYLSAEPGTYTVTQTLADGDGVVLDVQRRSYQVESSADTGFGLTGTLAASPMEVAVGDPANLAYSLANEGNADLVGVPVVLSVVDPVSGQLVATDTFPADLATGDRLIGNWAWTAQGVPGQVLVAVLSATMPNGERTLAQTNLRIAQPVAPVIDVTSVDTSGARVLVLVTCRKGEALDVYSDNPDTMAPEGLNCTEDRAAVIRQKLTELGIEHTVVSTGAEFETELRCGAYDVYWVSGGSHKLSPVALGELREAMGRGDGILVDGFHDAAKGSLDSVLGLTAKGQQNRTELAAMVLPGSGLPAGAFVAPGRAVSYWLEGGTVVASFDDNGAPAIVSHGDGAGRSLVFAFSLPDLIARGYASADPWPGELLAEAIAQVQAPARDPWPDEPVEVAVQLANPGQVTAYVTAVATLPPGLALLSASPDPLPPAPDADRRIVWTLPLGAGAGQALRLWVSGQGAGSYLVPFVVASSETAGGALGQSSELGIQVTIGSSDGLSVAAAAAIDAVVVSGNSDGAALDRARLSAGNAIAAAAGADPARALAEWVEAGKALRGIGSGDTASALQAVSTAIRVDERALCDRMSCIDGALSVTVAGVAHDELDANEAAQLGVRFRNLCPAPFISLDLAARLVSRATGGDLVLHEESLSLADADGEQQRQIDWLAPNRADAVDGLFTIHWQGVPWHLDHIEVEIEPPVAP